jgi:membrane protein
MHWIRNLFPNLFLAAKRWVADEASSLAAAVAYYLALSLFPMILLIVSGFGLFLQYTNLGQNAELQFLEMVGQNGSPVIQKQVSGLIGQFRNQSVVSGPFGLIAAVIAAIGVFAQFDRGFDKIWRVPPRPDTGFLKSAFGVLRDRSFAFLMLLSLGGCVVLLFCANVALGHVLSMADVHIPGFDRAAYILEFLATLLVNALLFMLVYRWLPKQKVLWRDAFRGGLLTAIVWAIGRVILGVFLIGMRYTSAYGAVGSFIAILLWCYYGVSIIFFGAEYVQVLKFRREGDPSGDLDNLAIESEIEIDSTSKIKPRKRTIDANPAND